MKKAHRLTIDCLLDGVGVCLVGLGSLGCPIGLLFSETNNPIKELQAEINDSLKASISLRFHQLLLELENEIMEMPALIPLTLLLRGKQLHLLTNTNKSTGN